jgi:adenylylsulfate kinase
MKSCPETGSFFFHPLSLSLSLQSKNDMSVNASTIDSFIKWPAMRFPKEAMLRQHGRVIWMCGLSGAGKSTLAASLDQELFKRGYLSQVIDGDVVRSGLNKGLGFTEEERHENLRRVAEVAKLFLNCGVISIVSFISPTQNYRTMARNIIGEKDFLEVYINAPLDVCETRDIKGLYKKARAGMIHDFTGIDSPFEPPVNPGVEIKTESLSVEESTRQLLDYVLPLVEYTNKHE